MFLTVRDPSTAGLAFAPPIVRISAPCENADPANIPVAVGTFLRVPENISPISIDETAILATTLLGRSTADILIHLRQNRIFSTLGYASTIALLFLGCILFTFLAFNFHEETVWITALRWFFTCCIPLSVLQLLFGTFRLSSVVLKLMLWRFDVWYLFWQTSFYFWGCLSLVKTDWQCVVWIVFVVWSTSNIILIDAMQNSSRERSGTSAILVCIAISSYTTVVAVVSPTMSKQTVYFFLSPIFERLGGKSYFLWPANVIGEATLTMNLYCLKFLWSFYFHPSEAVHVDSALVRSLMPLNQNANATIRASAPVSVINNV